MREIVLTVLIAFLGGYLGIRLKIPAGALIGAMAAVAILNIATGRADFPAEAKFYTQISTGAFIGVKINKRNLDDLKSILKPALILSAVLLVFTFVNGAILCRMADVTLATALFGLAPAGITDMTLASMDFDAETALVALFQTIRVLVVLCVVPPMVKRIHRKEAIQSCRNERPCSQKKEDPSKIQNHSAGNLALTILAALVGGYIGKLLGIPAGAISCSMLVCALFNVFSGRGYMPERLRRFIQIFAGTLIGCTIGREQVMHIMDIYGVILFIGVGYIILTLVAATLIHRFAHMDFTTALFACAPGGISDIAIIADEMNVNSVQVACIHILRLISVVMVYPVMISRIV